MNGNQEPTPHSGPTSWSEYPSGQDAPQGPYWSQPSHYPGSSSQNKQGSGLLIGALGVASVLAIGALGWAVGSGQTSLGIGLPQQSKSTVVQVDSSTAMSDAVNKVIPGLVDINTVLGAQNGEAAGTGIVLTSDGEVLTNNHVVEGATQISVTDIGNGTTYQATVVGYDRSEDVAILRLANASGLTTAPLGDSSTVKQGNQIAGVGNAGGVGGTPSVAVGQVTALDQSITASDDSSGSSEQLAGLIQVAANIQPGDSGGPLVSTDGKVIGMDTAASQNYRLGSRNGRGPQTGGEGFAIPINQAMTLAHQIEAGAASNTVHIGATALLGVSVSDTASGVTVEQLVADGPAEQAGLLPNDLITALDGQTVESGTTLTTLLDQHHPGDKVSLTWTDQQGQQHSAILTLITGPVG